MTIDQNMMKRALQLAAKGYGTVNPNPMVGAVIAIDGRIIGEGYHTACGKAHAEREAIKDMRRRGENGNGATLYVSLEPCCHYGKTPPCTEAILETQIKRVVVAQRDPNPLVSGKGIEVLKASGIEVVEGVCEHEARQINRIFNHWVGTKMPYVILKAGMTLDGKLSAADGTSQWITSEVARNHQHELRQGVMAIMVGSQTAIQDDPQLTCRKVGVLNKKLYRIVVDRQLNLPEHLNIFKITENSPTLIFTESNNAEKILRLRQKGVEVHTVLAPLKLQDVMAHLGHMGIDSILLEGGATMNALMLEHKLIHAVHLYVAPKLSGSSQSLGLFGFGKGFEISQLPQIGKLHVSTVGEDLLITGEIKYEA